MTNESPRASARLPRAAASAILLALVAACSSPAAPTGSTGPSNGPNGPTPSPTVVAGIDHPTGATDVVLRMESGGGFVPIGFIATAAPTFTLYGDGTVIWRDPAATQPDPVGNVMRLAPFRVVRLDEGAVQALLEQALGPGGLGIATGPYIGLGADIPTTTFTIAADGRTKAVSVTGLSPDMHPQNAAIVGALAHLAERLQGFGSVVAGGAVYQPARYRGVLISVDQPFGPVVAWPWPGVKPAEFRSGENEFFMTRSMSPAEITALGIPGVEGGFQGLTLQSDGKLYTFALRPLLPDENT